MQTWGEGREGVSLLIPGKWAVKESWHILIFTTCPEAFGLGPSKVSIVFLPLSLTCWLTWDKSPNLMRPLKTPVPIMKWCANTSNCPPGASCAGYVIHGLSVTDLLFGYNQKSVAINPRPRRQQGAWQVKVSKHSCSVGPYWQHPTRLKQKFVDILGRSFPCVHPDRNTFVERRKTRSSWDL